ncbi:aspartyl protease family protein [Candidatus Latescibacterota bacterium]
MKKYFSILFFLIFILLFCGCSFRRLQISKYQRPPTPVNGSLNKNITPEVIVQELKDGHFRTAEQMLNSYLVGETEDTFELHLSMGIMYHRQNRLQAALAEYELCRSRVGTVKKALLKRDMYHNLATLHYDLNDFENAAYYFNKYKTLGGTEYDDSLIRFFELFDRVPYQIDFQKQKTNVSMKYRMNVIKARGSINSKEVDILVDTAANFNIVSSKIAKKMGIKPVGIEARVKGSKIGELTAGYGIIDSVQIGDITVKNIPVVIIDSNRLTFKAFGILPYFKIEALLGLPFIRQFNITLDYKKKCFRLPFRIKMPGAHHSRAIFIFSII